jgi:hypothetical protein
LEYVAMLGVSGKTPVDPVELLRLGKTVVDNLTDIKAPTDLKKQEPRVHGNSWLYLVPI